MGAVLSTLLAGFATLHRSRLALHAEILTLRHQLVATYQRTAHCPKMRTTGAVACRYELNAACAVVAADITQVGAWPRTICCS